MWYPFKGRRQAKRRANFYTALRSGGYSQGRGVLCNPEQGTYCCLGVACEVAIKDGLKLHVFKRDRYASYAGQSGTLPKQVREWYGFPGSDPMLTFPLPKTEVNGSRRCSAAEANDEFNYNFTEIADAFQRTYH